ncbi:MAG: hypothetical protein AAFQ41_06015 [Cyanobacteria bacterium J06623_7]
MDTTIKVSKQELQERLATLQSQANYQAIAELLTFALEHAASEVNRQVFNYIPHLFREIAINNPVKGISPSQISIGEPIIYKISFPQDLTMRGIPYFYLFCYLKPHSDRLNVYFKSAARTSRNLTQKKYDLSHQTIRFEGLVSAFKSSTSAISVSDPGHFIPELISSFYMGSRQINFPELISNIIESICISAKIKLENTFLFGSSAGGMGALLSSTYFSNKVQVMAVNAQIITYDLPKVTHKLLGSRNRQTLLKKFANRISCLNRFQQNISSIPNIYLLANVNDSLHHRNYKFYQLYQQLFVASGQANQSIFDSYYGVEGHGRPDKVSLKQKMDIARASLSMKSNLVADLQYPVIESAKQHQNKINSDLQKTAQIQTLQQQLLQARSSPIVPPLNDRPRIMLSGELARYQNPSAIAEREIAVEAFKLKCLKPQQYPQPGAISTDNSTIIGKDGWMYINSGTNSLMAYHVGQKRLPLAKVNQWQELLSARVSWHDARKIGYRHLFVPNKIAVYPEYYPESLNIVGKRPIVQLQQVGDRLFSYPLDLFEQYKAQYRLYERQDCHWSFWGCYLAYQDICQQLKITPNLDLLDAPIEIIRTKGDLGGKLKLTEITLRKNLQLNSKLTYDNQVIKYRNQGSVRILKNNAISDGKIIIFGDSFSNPKHLKDPESTRRVGRLATLFAETLNEVHFVWTPWVDYDYIEQERPDFVLTEMAERFMVRVPNDRDHLPLEEFAAQKLKEYQLQHQ